MSIKEVDAFGLQQMQAGGEVVMIDVRTDVEFAQGSIQGAKHLPLHMLSPHGGSTGECKASGVDLPQRCAIGPGLCILGAKGIRECV